jgi:hypothetical protein
VGCQDNLAKCGYCRWFDAATRLCTHPIVSGLFEVSESATPPCVYHDPSVRVLARRPLLKLVLVATGMAAAAMLLFGLFKLGLRGPAIPEQADLGLLVEADYEGAVVGKPYTVTAVVYNTSPAPVTGVRFEIAKRSLEVFDLLSVKPATGGAMEHGKWRSISYPALRPGERRRIRMTLRPKMAGTLHVMVRLVSGGNVFHGLADLPVIVEETQAGVKAKVKSRKARRGDATQAVGFLRLPFCLLACCEEARH